MLMMPSDASGVARIIGIDPGSNTLGVAELSFDVETLEIVNITAVTLTASRHTKNFWSNELHGDRFGRINWLEEELLDIFRVSQPFQIALEAPFFSRLHPNAYQVLVEVKAAVMRAVSRYTSWKQLHEIDPPTVKRAVGAKGNADKVAMREHVLALNLPYTGKVPIEQLDEHSIDGIAVAICRFNKMLEELCLR